MNYTPELRQRLIDRRNELLTELDKNRHMIRMVTDELQKKGTR